MVGGVLAGISSFSYVLSGNSKCECIAWLKAGTIKSSDTKGGFQSRETFKLGTRLLKQYI